MTGAGRMDHFEDLIVGQKARFGRYEVTREEVRDFARKYDPQPFHLSDEAAAKRERATPARCGRKARIMSFRTAT